MALRVRTVYTGYGDIASDVRAIRITEGTGRFGHIWSMKMQIDLDDPTGRYGMGGSRPLEPGTLIRVDETGGSINEYAGVIEKLHVDMLSKVVTVFVVDLLTAHKEEVLTVPVTQGVTVRQAAALVLSRLNRFPQVVDISGLNVIDDPDNNEIDNTSIWPSDDNLGNMFSEGGSLPGRNLSYFGDMYEEGASLFRILRDLLATDGGKLLPDGRRYRFETRADLYAYTSQATVNLDADAISYQIGEDRVGVVEVTYRPRSTTIQGLVYTLSSPQRVNGQSEREFKLSYRDVDGNPAAAQNVVMPSMVWNSERDGTGWDTGAYVDVFVDETDGSAFVFRAVNRLGVPVYLQPGMQIVGDRLERENPVTVRAENGYVRHYNRGSTMRIDALLLDDTEEADNLARFELARRGQIWTVDRVRVRAGRDGGALGVACGQIITVSVGSDVREYHIAGKDMAWEPGSGLVGTIHLEPSAGEFVFTIDEDLIDGGRFIGW